MIYGVFVGGKLFIIFFVMGFEGCDGFNFFKDFQIENIEFIIKDEIWIQFWGENKFIWNYYNEMVVCLKDLVNIWLIFCFCVFDDGLGFCYEY